MRITKIKFPDETIDAEMLFGESLTINQYRKIVGRYVKEKMRSSTSLLLTEGFEAMEKERNKYEPYAKFLAYIN